MLRHTCIAADFQICLRLQVKVVNMILMLKNGVVCKIPTASRVGLQLIPSKHSAARSSEPVLMTAGSNENDTSHKFVLNVSKNAAFC